MTAGAAWVDEVCRDLQLDDVSDWLPWATREQGNALGAYGEGHGAAGVYLIGWGENVDAIEVLYIAGTGRARTRLSRLEAQVKWGLNYGFEALRAEIQQRGDHRTMRHVWVKMIPISEEPLFASSLLTANRLNALGGRRRQLEIVLLAEQYRRFCAPVPANRRTLGLFAHEFADVRPHRSVQHAAA